MRARKNQIYIGSLDNPTFYFENDQIQVCPVSQTVALVGQELCIDVFTPVVADSGEHMYDIYRFRSSDGEQIKTGVGQTYAIDMEYNPAGSSLINLPKDTPVWYYHQDELVGKFYIRSVTRKAKNQYELDCVSAIGLLDRKMHGGGLFRNSTFGTVLEDILAEDLHGTGDPVIDYAIDDEVAELPVSGWLPYASKRNNLYQLIFAYGVNIVKNYDGSPRFTFLYTRPSDDMLPLETGDIYNGGSVEYDKAYSQIVVSEHTYVAVTDIEPVTLFDNTNGSSVSNEEIWFDQAPVIISSLETTGSLTVIYATENSVTLTGQGVLTGKPYTHSVHTVSMRNQDAPEEKTVSVNDCTMVNVINSQNLLNRLYAYYCRDVNIRKVTNALVYTDERCGKLYKFKNPYGEDEVAFLANMEINASSVNKADCEWIAAYEPAGQAGLYSHVVVLKPEWDEEEQEYVYEGDWEVPEGVTEFKAVLIGGGTGGGSGWPGENGQDAYAYTEVEQGDDLSARWFGAEGGDGGNGGSGGTPGRVKTVLVENVTEGDSFHYVLGEGGEGGASTGFIPDTVSELRAALENENTDTEYTDAQIEAMIAQEDTDWSGSPHAGSAGTATSISDGTDTWSTADNDASVPTGGVYDPIYGDYYALYGKTGIRGGKGGARKIETAEDFTWVTDGESVVGDDGKTYSGGTTGKALTSVSGLSEAKIMAYGGNGAGAAVGIDKSFSHINGGSDQTASWEVREDG